VAVVIICILKCLFFFREQFYVSAGPDLRGGRGAALISWGAGDGESCLIIVSEVIYPWLYTFIVIFCVFFTK
jgi:hypothetical protein